MARKYKRGKQIKSVAEFENSKSDFFIVLYGPKEKTTHRGWLISWQYHFLYWTIKQGRVYEAKRKDGEDADRGRNKGMFQDSNSMAKYEQTNV